MAGTGKKLGLISLILLGINSIIGSGIFLLPGQLMSLAGANSIYLFGLVSIAVICIALCFAECASLFTRNGAAYVYAKEAFGEFVGFEVGMMKFAVSIIAWASMVAGFVTILGSIWPEVLLEPNRTILILAMLGILGVVNLLGVNAIKYLNNTITIAKLTPLVLIIAIGIFYIKGDNFAIAPPSLTFNGYGEAALIIFYAFSGFETLAISAEEVENPKKNLPKALITVILICSMIYILIQLIVIGVIGDSSLPSSTAVSDAASTIFGPAGKWIVTLGSLISIAGLNVASSYISPRSAVAIAQDGLIPKSIANQNRFGSPHVAILITVFLTAITALSADFYQLAAISVVSRLAQYMPTSLAVFVFRKTRPVGAKLVPEPFYTLTPLLAFAASFWLILQASPAQIFWGCGALLIGLPLYFLMKKLDPVPAPSLH